MQLLDIFSINPHTACNTHDLLDCPCDASGAASASKVLSREELDKAMDEALESSDEEEDPLKGFMAASQFKQKDINKIDQAVSLLHGCQKLNMNDQLNPYRST